MGKYPPWLRHLPQGPDGCLYLTPSPPHPLLTVPQSVSQLHDNYTYMKLRNPSHVKITPISGEIKDNLTSAARSVTEELSSRLVPSRRWPLRGSEHSSSAYRRGSPQPPGLRRPSSPNPVGCPLPRGDASPAPRRQRRAGPWRDGTRA